MKKGIVASNQWLKLKELTNARVALGNIGPALPLFEVLALKEAHAMAKDAIVRTLDHTYLERECKTLGLPCFRFKSQVGDRLEYLKRPDLGRKIETSNHKAPIDKANIVLVITDGLSAKAVNTNVFQVIKAVLPDIKSKYSISVALVEQGRVAIGDPIAKIFNADFVAVFIGERPGLSSPESMGIYTTYKPDIGITDERRNCISNIHRNGLSSSQASNLLIYLIRESFGKKISGVKLKIDLQRVIENN